jgi:hypothetical protein
LRQWVLSLPLLEPIIDQSSCQAFGGVFRSAKLRYRLKAIDARQSGSFVAAPSNRDRGNERHDHSQSRFARGPVTVVRLA